MSQSRPPLRSFITRIFSRSRDQANNTNNNEENHEEEIRKITEEKKAVEDAVPEYKIFKDHYHGLTTLLFSTNLTPYLIREGVIVPTDQEQLNAINTSAGKAEIVLPKISSALAVGITESFYKMLQIMKSYGNHDAQQLSIAIEHEIPGSKSDKEPIPSKEMDELSVDFSALVADVADILDKSPAVLNKLKLVCYSITTPEKSLLFSDKESAAIRASHSVFDIFYELRGHWRWDNSRLLLALIKRSGSPEALAKYEQFQKKLNYAKKLIEFTSYFQSVQKPLPSGYTRMIAIIEKDYSDFTLKECRELDEYLSDALGSAALPPANFENSNSIKVTWYIPTEAVSGILSKAYQAKELFQLLSISYFEIDGVVIWNTKWLSLQEETSKMDDLTKQLRHVRRQYGSVLDENIRLKQDESTLLASLKTREQSFKELERNMAELKEDQERILKERTACQRSEYIEALDKVIKTFSKATDVAIPGQTKEEVVETTTALEKLKYLEYETDDVKEMIEHVQCYAEKVIEQHLALYEICKGGDSFSDQKVVQQSSESMILKAELETLKKNYHQLMNIHGKSKIQKDKISVATQTEVVPVISKQQDVNVDSQVELTVSEPMLPAPMHDKLGFESSTAVNKEDGTSATNKPVEDTKLSATSADAVSIPPEIQTNESTDIPQDLTHSYRKVVYVVFSEDSEHWTTTILIPFLVELDVEVFTNFDAIPGTSLISTIDESINKADKIILVISKQSIKEKNFIYSIDYALHKRVDPRSISIIPVLYENVTYNDTPKQILHLNSLSNNNPWFEKRITRSILY